MSSSKKQRRKRRKFRPEYKADVVRLCQDGGESIADVCRRLDLTETTVRNWVKQAGGGPGGRYRGRSHDARA